MKESKFITEVVNSLKSQGLWAYKVPDMPASWMGGTGLRFVPEKPCDIIAMRGKIGLLIECKQIKKFEAFGMRHMRESQIKNLNEVTDKGGLGFVFLNIRIASPRENRLIIFEWQEFRYRTESIKGKEIKEFPFIQGFKDEFDLFSFVGNLCTTI